MIFRCHAKPIDDDGFMTLRFFTKEKYEQYKINSKITNKKYRDRGNKKRLNPDTGSLWVKGEINKDGLYFIGYETAADADGFYHMRFGDFEKYKKRRLQNTFKNIKERCAKNNIPCHVDVDYLLSIYPKDNKCPVLGIELEFGGGLKNLRNSPSIDRIIPERGYVKGNLVVISYFANSIKQNATPEELMKVARWYESITN
jgi:hypothetical protein